MMKGIIIFIFLTLLSLNLLLAQKVLTKDGYYLGEMPQLVNDCVRGAGGDIITVYGVTLDAKQYCKCMIEEVFMQAYMYELDEVAKNGSIEELLLKDKYLERVQKCFTENASNLDQFNVPKGQKTEFTVQGATKLCIQNIINDPEKNKIWTEELAKDYCLCAMDKLQDQEIDTQVIIDTYDENSIVYNEILLPCLNEAINSETNQFEKNSYVKGDIFSDLFSTKVSLITDYSKGYKLKISINGLEKYYLLDTGASLLTISKEMAAEFYNKGYIKSSDYLGSQEFILANNQIIKADIVKISNIKIGDFRVNNVTVAVVDDGLLLCGKGFLDKFRKWEFDSNNNALILYK